MQSFDVERDGVQDRGIVILGFRSTGGRELRHKGRWYRSRSGRPMLAQADHPAVHSGDCAPAIDFFERIEPSHDISGGRTVRMACGTCGKLQFFFFPNLQPGYMEQEATCRACLQAAR